MVYQSPGSSHKFKNQEGSVCGYSGSAYSHLSDPPKAGKHRELGCGIVDMVFRGFWRPSRFRWGPDVYPPELWRVYPPYFRRVNSPYPKVVDASGHMVSVIIMRLGARVLVVKAPSYSMRINCGMLHTSSHASHRSFKNQMSNVKADLVHWVTTTNFIPIYAESQGLGFTLARGVICSPHFLLCFCLYQMYHIDNAWASYTQQNRQQSILA